MKACANRKAQRALEALFLGKLDAEGLTWLRAHARECPACGEAYDKLARVESSLEQRALPEGRQALLEKELFARLTTEARKSAARDTPPTRFVSHSFRMATLGFAIAGVLAAIIIPPLVRQSRESEWQARSAQEGSAWGVRAFCVTKEGQVQGEALPGGTLACAEGNAVQFSYTAPQVAWLSIEALSPSGETLRFYPSGPPSAQVASGVDVPLPFSTPVEGGWLSGPLPVRARFVDAEGKTLSETSLTLTPR